MEDAPALHGGPQDQEGQGDVGDDAQADQDGQLEPRQGLHQPDALDDQQKSRERLEPVEKSVES